ncbi:RING-H2 finger protein [Quillaja saponaria]|uniref:RING-type E3 ubiquitin transferase n=1 Tax=Quillaja saponaria TaxID=32244 RepID=A0AAD7KR92_QUISA|nr:RING-H2 finger protein [Quillaja saponaria]
MDDIYASEHRFIPEDASRLRYYSVPIFIVAIMFGFGIILCICTILHSRLRRRQALAAPVATQMDVEMQAMLPPRPLGIDPHVLERIPEFDFHSGTEVPYGTDRCAWCLDDFVEGERLSSLPPCRHVFHMHCIHHYLSRATTCPSCRGVVSLPDSFEDKEDSS